MLYQIRAARSSDIQYAQTICNWYEISSQERGIGIAKRSTEYVQKKVLCGIRSGEAKATQYKSVAIFSRQKVNILRQAFNKFPSAAVKSTVVIAIAMHTAFFFLASTTWYSQRTKTYAPKTLHSPCQAIRAHSWASAATSRRH